MGFFSRRRSSTDEEALSSSELYVFIRSTDPSLAGNTEWSLAVSERSASSLHHRYSDDQSDDSNRTKRSFSALTTRGSSPSSSDSDSDSTSSHSSSPPQTFREFPLPSSKLTTTDTHTTTASDPPQPHPLLIKILLPRTLPPKPKLKSRTPFTHHLEHVLQTHRSSPPESQLRSCLLTLQQSHHLPPPPSFTVSRLLDFAHNHLAALRDELQTGNAEPRELDYAAHLAENERLRAHFGHAEDEESDEEEGAGPREVNIGGGWWITWPMAEQGDRRGDVYGGLM